MSNRPIGRVEMTNDEYHAAPGDSCSHIKTFAQSPMDYFDKYIDPPAPLLETDPPTLAERWSDNVDLDVGTAIHTAVLEPDLMTRNIIVMPGLNLRTNAGKAERDAILAKHYPEKMVLRAEDFELVKRCRDAVHKHPVAKKLFEHGRAEETTFAIDPETGELIKCRTDWRNDHISAVVDVKSCRDSSPAAFARDVANLRYHFQPPWYFNVLEAHEGEQPRHWIWLAISKGLRPRVEVYFQQPDDIVADAAEVFAAHRQLVEMRRENAWPKSYTDAEIKPLHMPGWHRKRA